MRIFELNIFGVTLAPSYYGLMYALAFILAFLLLRRSRYFTSTQLDSLMIYVFLGVVVGGRLGYVFIYNLPYYIDNPVEILQPWKGGMSFHGGLIGVILACWMFCRRNAMRFVPTIEQLALVTPIGLLFGRIGNYINGELLGVPGYDGPLAVQLQGQSYFPTPLLEAFLEGVVLFLLLQLATKKLHKPGQVGSLFLIGYGAFRFVAEFFRTPDVQIGYLAFGWYTMGHLLSTCMIVIGIVLLMHFSATGKRKAQSSGVQKV